MARRILSGIVLAAACGIATIPMLLAMALFALMARDSPHRVPPSSLREYAAVLREPDTIWLSLLYSLTFGGFVGYNMQFDDAIVGLEINYNRTLPSG